MYETRLRIPHPHIWVKEKPTYEQDGVWVTLHCAICKAWRSRPATDYEITQLRQDRGER